MSLPTYRIIPKVDIKNSNVVKGYQMEGLRALGDPLNFCKAYYEDGADEIIINDLTASMIGRSNLFDIIKHITSIISIPITIGGGVRTIEDISNLLKIGADKVFINTQAILNPDFITKAVKIFGSSTITVSIETLRKDDGNFYCFYNNGREQTNIELKYWINETQKLGCGEILLSSINYDGSKKGYDSSLLNYIDTNLINVPLIFNSGFNDYKSIVDVIEKYNEISGFCISSKLHYEFIENNLNDVSVNEGGNTDFIKKLINKNKYKNKNQKYSAISNLKQELYKNNYQNFRLL